MPFLSETIESCAANGSESARAPAIQQLLQSLLEAKSVKRAADEHHLTARQVVAILAWPRLGDDATPPTLTQTQPKNPTIAPTLSTQSLATIFPHTPKPLVQSLSAGLLQIHDFWDASHAAAQAADDAGESRFAPYWHGIAHRREPDPDNAAYWFRRVGRHPIMIPLAAATIQSSDTPAPRHQLIKGTEWNALAMINLCAGARYHDETHLAVRLQAIEMELLLEANTLACESA